MPEAFLKIPFIPAERFSPLSSPLPSRLRNDHVTLVWPRAVDDSVNRDVAAPPRRVFVRCTLSFDRIG